MTDLFVLFLAAGGLCFLPFSTFLGFLAFKSLVSVTRSKGPTPQLFTFPKLLAVVPAHNEEASIAFTIRSLKAADYPPEKFQILVLADNCSDGTADLAESEGALVIKRVDPVRRGKGFALEDGFARIYNDPIFAEVEGFLVIDADSIVMANIFHQFALALQRGAEFIQCYGSVGNPDASIRTKLLNYALSLFNGVYLLGLDNAGLGAHLRGNGMGFSRLGLKRIPWSASSLAEDLEFSWRLRLGGASISFLADTTIFSEMPSKAETSISQRARWEHGREQLKRIYTKSVLSSDASFFKRTCWLVDLWMPSLSILGGAVILFLLTTAIFIHGHISIFPLNALAILNSVSLLAYLVAPFFVMKLPLKYIQCLWFAPYYALWRMAVLLKKKPDSWIRTARERNGNVK